MIKKHLFFLAIPLLLAGCESKDIVSMPDVSKDANRDFVVLITDFLSETRAASDSEEVEIVSVETRTYNGFGEEVEAPLKTRSAENDRTFTLSTVRFSHAGSQGFCILSDDERLDDIYYLAEYGEPSDTSFNVLLKEYIETVPRIAANDLTKEGASDISEAKYIGPLVEYKWGQGYPFNIVAPLCNGPYCSTPEFKGHRPVGCGPLALAEFIATTKYNGRYSVVDLFNLPLTNDAFVLSQQDNIFNFMSDMTSACNVDFGCEDIWKKGSGISRDGFYSMNQYLVGLQYVTDYRIEDKLDESKLFTQLKLGAPHIMAGKDIASDSGHAWLIDGIRQYSTGCMYRCMYHCVWGWNGSGDGWIKGEYYTSSQKDLSFSKEQLHIYITRMPLGYIKH